MRFLIMTPVVTLTYFMVRSTQFVDTFQSGKLLICHLKGKTCKKCANEQKIYNSEKIWTPGVGLPPPCCSTLVYYHNIQRSSPQLRSHMQKTVQMSLKGKTFPGISMILEKKKKNMNTRVHVPQLWGCQTSLLIYISDLR